MQKTESVKQELAKSGKNFLALSPLPALKVHFQFIGKLQDEEVLWDATLQTLASHLAENPPAKPAKRALQIRSSMHVFAPEQGVSQIKVVLPVLLIDEPTIQKTIIMVRCYKRLKVGYHEFGKDF